MRFVLCSVEDYDKNGFMPPCYARLTCISDLDGYKGLTVEVHDEDYDPDMLQTLELLATWGYIKLVFIERDFEIGEDEL